MVPWKESDAMDQRLQFVTDALSDRFTMTELCERYGVSRRIGYKWLARFTEDGKRGLVDRTRRPHTCPTQIRPVLAELLCEFRRLHTERPHDALGVDTPASRYTGSRRPCPERLPAPEYPGHFLVKRVTDAGKARCTGRPLSPDEGMWVKIPTDSPPPNGEFARGAVGSSAVGSSNEPTGNTHR